MIVTNLRLEIDQTTFDPYVAVDCKISLEVLQDLHMNYDEVQQNDLYFVLGKELIDQINELRVNK